jgi:predicted aldo/keto reductase-like oxidoreductase
VIKDVLKTPEIDVILVAYNFAMEQGLTPLIEQAAKAGIGVIAMKVFAGGFRSSTPYQSPGRLRKMLKNPGAMLAALKWVLANPNVTSAIPSMVDTDQVEENFRAMAEPFGEEDVKFLSAHLEEIRPLYCRMCGRCDGHCGQGVPVQDVLRALAYAEGYGQVALGRKTFRGLPGVAACSNCSGCTVRCPHGVEVAARMQRAQELLA